MIPSEKKIPVIYYHSVAQNKNKNWVLNFLTLETKYFEEHLSFFVRNNYESISLTEYFDLRNINANGARYRYCITLDDGYVDNFTFVFPLLKKYKIKATIFVNPEFVDRRDIVRKNLEDYWLGKISFTEIDSLGFLSWSEMRLMEKSGLVDIQSHTLTHAKYFISDRIIDLHHPGANCLHAAGNLFPGRKPYYITDDNFEKLIPYGYPFFEEGSSVIARRVFINEDFVSEVAERLKKIKWQDNYSFNNIYSVIEPVYKEYKNKEKLISSVESEYEYEQRLLRELALSKEIIEKELDKKVDFLCWPYGDNNEYTHNKALKCGYKATSAGKMVVDETDITRFERFGLDNVRNNVFLTNLKTLYKVNSFQGIKPYSSIKKAYEYLRDNF